MKIIINAEADMFSIVFSDESPDYCEWVEPGMALYTTEAGHITEIDIVGLREHMNGGTVKALELDLAPDHSGTYTEINLPESALKRMHEAQEQRTPSPRRLSLKQKASAPK